jgi:hypothetical protein
VLIHAATPEQIPVGLDGGGLVDVGVIVVDFEMVDVVVLELGGTAAPPHALIADQSLLGLAAGTDDANHLACGPV